jgi:glycosyltransferase involved in cell wall biosynthesis
MKKILIHTMNHNKHYDYFRRLANSKLGDRYEVFYLIQKPEEQVRATSIVSKIKCRFSVEKRLFKISLRNNELAQYFLNRFLSIFFNKYKHEYDKGKLQYIDNHFVGLIGNIPHPDKNIFYIDNINNQKQLIEEINPDLMVVVGAPFIKSNIVNLNFKKINLHLGYLPNYRGIKTIEWAILNEEFDKVGYTIHELTNELDGGAIILRKNIIVDPDSIDLKVIYAELYEKAFFDLIKLISSEEISVNKSSDGIKHKIYYGYKFNPLNYKKLIKKKIKMAIFAGNPVQYHVPIYKALACEDKLELTVMFGSEIGSKRFYSKEFKTFIEWDIPLLDGYKYKFYKNLSLEGTKGFFSRINFGMFFDVLRNKYDVVLIHGYDTVSSWLVFIAAKIIRANVIWRGEASVRPKAYQNSVKKFIKNNMLPIYFRYCDAVLYSCSGNKEFLRQFDIDQKKMFLIPCAVDNVFFRRARLGIKESNQLRSKLDVSDDDFVILFSARFTPRKRPLDLIEATSKIYNKNIVLLFVGDGPEKPEMARLAKGYDIRCIFTGFIGQNELPSYYSIADMYAIVSDYDASPKSLNEALNFELPILVTDKVGTAVDLVENNRNGYIVSSRDTKTMGKKIDFLNKNREVAVEMGKNSLPVSDNWSIESDVVGIKKAINYFAMDV